MFGKKKVAMAAAEFLGAYALASAVFAMASRTPFPFFGAAAAGVTLAVMVLVIGSVSGSHINPAVTFGLWTVRKVPGRQAVVFVAAQMLGGFVALRTNQYLANQVFANSAAVNWDWRVVAAETIGTFVFTFGIAAAVYKGYEGTQLAATIGASLFVGVLLASFGAAGVLNPAVALGVNSWSASYVVAPFAGALVGMQTYALLFAPEKAAAKKRG
ncbi:MAG TPA: aquaporin [Candidatus Limnocylindria bacterium]|nr:aquaporin [Candidatus Limnocylindria bacterium]